ncbi:hypothetical protein [Flammeovirga kamogawensis]|uniref:Uncharacterized protein n=1 Tax=Flammeovirga kamogawensis TaxID=373891 RepID=A0ABX8GQZ9_9BACT|nr:hypothetical protein [Flammeovirga kamogawensis]MBB6463207.1 hypothetical protein [Flammeovirga kamogawensis]QWG05941.1 hypothetical protein KM029_11230 [Flammeovirga kamogawensis]TRX67766.1 hypothetical protein EO216_06240 [Flammeovirga kamogawensis]
MKHFITLIAFTFLSFSGFSQNVIDVNFEKYWNSFSEYTIPDIEIIEQREREKFEIAKFRNKIRDSIKNELIEVYQLSNDIHTNFVIIEDHLQIEFEALGIPYISYESINTNVINKEHWIDHHTRKIVEHKMARVEQELKEFYD